MRRLRKLLLLSGSDRRLLLTTVVLLSAVRLGLWLLTFRILLKILRRCNQVISEDQSANPVSVGKIIWAVNVASRYMPGGVKCLARALTAQVLMCRQGYSPELRIGVAKGEGGLEAHAWIEYEGQVAIGNLTDLSRFIPLPSLEGVKL